MKLNKEEKEIVLNSLCLRYSRVMDMRIQYDDESGYIKREKETIENLIKRISNLKEANDYHPMFSKANQFK